MAVTGWYGPQWTSSSANLADLARMVADLMTAQALLESQIAAFDNDNDEALALKADDAVVVKLTGTQTIAGTKTFTSSPAVPDGSFTVAKTTGLQAALDGKAPATGIAQSAVTNLVSDLASKATPAQVSAAVAALVNSAPGALDTLNELAAALGNDPNFATTITNALAGKQPLDSDLTAIAALSTTAYGRALLALADAAAGRTALGLGTAATQNTAAFDAAGAAAAAQAASQPVDSDLTAIAALSTTSFGRSLLALADGAALAGAIPSGTYVQVAGVSNGNDDTATLNSLLAASLNVKGAPGQSYLITSPLVVRSGGTLDMTGCSVTLKAASLSNMVRNAGVTAQRTTTGSIDVGVSTTTLNTASAVAADVGRTVTVAGAGSGGSPVTSLVTAAAAGVSLTLATPAVTTVSGAAVSVYTRDANIRIIGGLWDRGANSGATSLDTHSMFFRHVDGLYIGGQRFASSGGKFAVSIGDCTDFTTETMRFATQSDGVHVAGPAARGVIRNFYGTTGDDSVAFTPEDYTGYNDTAGNITDVSVRDIFTTAGRRPDGTDNPGHCVKLLGGRGVALKRINVSNVFGACTASGNGAVLIGDDTAGATTIGGLIDQVTVQNVAPNAYLKPAVFINATNAGRVRIDGVQWDSTSATVNPVLVTANTVVAQLELFNVTCKSLGFTVLGTSASAAINTVVVNNVSVASPVAGINLIASFGGNVTNATFSNINIAGASAGAVVNIAATVSNLVIDKVLHSGTGLAHVVNVSTAGVVTDLAISNVVHTAGTGSLVKAAQSTSTVTRLTASNCHHIGSGGGSLLSAVTSTQTLAYVELSNVTITAASWIADLATVTEMHLSNVTHRNQASGSWNVRANCTLTVRGDGNTIGGNPSIAGGGHLIVKSFGIQVDITNIDKTANDMAYNTNAALACGAGPVVSNGTTWKHLYSGATYP